MTPIPVMQFMPQFAIGGTERQVIGLTGHLDRARFAAHYGCFRRWGEFLPDVERQGMPVHVYPISSFHGVDTAVQQARYARDLRRLGIRVLHAYNFYANVFAIPAARAVGLPCVIASIRDLGTHLTPTQRRVQRWVCRLADRVVVNAEAVRASLVAEGYPAGKIHVIRNGLDLARFDGVRPHIGLRQLFALPPRSRLVVMLARLDPNKGIEYFIDAAPRIAAACPDARFVIFGDRHRRGNDGIERDTDYLAALQRRADARGAGALVRFAGDHADGPALLADADVSVLPSLSEAMPNAVLESMAMGVPVVATRVGGTPEAVEHGRHGLLVPPRDAMALADAVIAVLNDRALAERLSHAARQRIERHFALDRMARENETLYLELLERRARRAVRPGAATAAIREEER